MKCKHGIHEGCLLCPEGTKLTLPNMSPTTRDFVRSMELSLERSRQNGISVRDLADAYTPFTIAYDESQETVLPRQTLRRGPGFVQGGIVDRVPEPSPQNESQETVPEWYIEGCDCAACRSIRSIRRRREAEENSPRRS